MTNGAMGPCLRRDDVDFCVSRLTFATSECAHDVGLCVWSLKKSIGRNRRFDYASANGPATGRVISGETASDSMAAPKEQPPRKLSGKRTDIAFEL
jgi:hypothetical protein